MTTLAPSFLIGSSFLQVTRTTIRSRMGSKFGKIRPEIAELTALEGLEKSAYTCNLCIKDNLVNMCARFQLHTPYGLKKQVCVDF